MKFSVRLTALFSGVFLVIGSITSYLVYTSNLKILESQIKYKLEDQAFHTMDKIDRMLFERFTDIKVIATDPVISSRNSTPKQIREKLIAYRNNYRSYVSLSFFDLNRVMITDTIGIDIGKQHPRITYWLDIAGGKEFVFDVSKSIPLGFSVFHFAMVVKDKNGSPFGVVVIRMPVEKLYDMTKGTFGIDQEDEQGLTIDLVNKEGLLIYSNYNRKGILNEILPNWEYLKRFLKSGKKTGSFREHYQGEDVIHVFALEQGYLDFKGEDWTFIIHAPIKVIFAPAIELRNRLIIVLLVMAFLALVSIFLFSHTMTRPLAKLTHASIEIGKGNFDAKVESSSKDEIGQLGVSFNKMVEDLKEYRDKLLAYSSELETKVTERTIELMNANERLQLELIERKQVEMALQESEGLYRTLIETSPDAIVLADMNTKFIMVNQVAVRLYGYQNAEEMIGKTFLDLIVPEERPRLFEHFKDTRQTGSNQILEHTSLKKDGSSFYAAVNASLMFDAQGRPKGTIAIIRDMSERKRAEDEREKLIHELQDALGKIKTLSGLLPICASCKKIRDDKGYWNRIEAYIEDHSEAEFTHSICPECMKKLYPDFAHNENKEVIKEKIK